MHKEMTAEALIQQLPNWLKERELSRLDRLVTRFSQVAKKAKEAL